MNDSLKSWLGLGLSAILFTNPIILLVLVIVGIVVLAIGLTVIIFYGLVTALVLFAISGLAIVLLRYVGLIDLQKQPLILLIPFAFFGLGYFSEHLRIFSVNPQYPTGTGALTLFTDAPAQLILLIVIVSLVIVGIAALIKRRR